MLDDGYNLPCNNDLVTRISGQLTLNSREVIADNCLVGSIETYV